MLNNIATNDIPTVSDLASAVGTIMIKGASVDQ